MLWSTRLNIYLGKPNNRNDYCGTHYTLTLLAVITFVWITGAFLTSAKERMFSSSEQCTLQHKYEKEDKHEQEAPQQKVDFSTSIQKLNLICLLSLLTLGRRLRVASTVYQQNFRLATLETTLSLRAFASNVTDSIFTGDMLIKSRVVTGVI